MRDLSRLGYRCAPIKASGRRGERRIGLRCVPGDLIAFAPLLGQMPHLLCEVGGVAKRFASCLAELEREGLPPGFVALVAVCRGRRWTYATRQGRFPNLEEAVRGL